MSATKTIAIAMSGGVDSSVAAALIAKSGERAFGLMLRLWSAGPDLPNRCCSPRDMANARRIAATLGIPFYVVEAQDDFKKQVVDPFIDGYAQGITPNPCLACNRQIRWGLLMDRAMRLGATHLATGHYARLSRSNGSYHLHRAADRTKDQSYVLSVLRQEDLARTLFPIGDQSKEMVREIAGGLGLITASRPDSQDLCFLGGSDYRDFISDVGALPVVSGPIVDTEGRQIGSHTGLSNFTIGQRKGIGISAAEPLYVIRKDTTREALVVGPREMLARTSFVAGNMNWVLGTPPQPGLDIGVQVRYRAREVGAKLNPSGGQTRVDLVEPLPGITPGQAAVFYSGSECLGGGLISP